MWKMTIVGLAAVTVAACGRSNDGADGVTVSGGTSQIDRGPSDVGTPDDRVDTDAVERGDDRTGTRMDGGNAGGAGMDDVSTNGGMNTDASPSSGDAATEVQGAGGATVPTEIGALIDRIQVVARGSVAAKPNQAIDALTLQTLVDPRLGVYVDDMRASSRNDTRVARQSWMQLSDLRGGITNAADVSQAAFVTPLVSFATMRRDASSDVRCDGAKRSCDIKTAEGFAHFVFGTPEGGTQLRLLGVLLHDDGPSATRDIEQFDQIVMAKMGTVGTQGTPETQP